MKRGFTLIELVIVVAILAIIAVLALGMGGSCVVSDSRKQQRVEQAMTYITADGVDPATATCKFRTVNEERVYQCKYAVDGKKKTIRCTHRRCKKTLF
jgi:prepilin-type N-terminal cleavage/methylation domain-containing protein